MTNNVRFGSLLAALAVSVVFGTPSLAWPPGGSGGGGNGGGGGGSGGGTSAPQFTWTQLDDFGGGYAHAESINNDGDIVGYSWLVIETSSGSQTTQHAFVSFVDGSGTRVMLDLHELIATEGLIDPPLDCDSRMGWLVADAWSINDSGQFLVGLRHFDGPGAPDGYVARYTPAQLDELGDVVADATLNFVEDAQGARMNDTGLVVASDFSGAPAFFWDEVNGRQDLPPPPFYGVPVGLNSANQVCGEGAKNVWVYTPGSGYWKVFGSDLYAVRAGGINDHGQVAGSARKSISADYQAFRTTNQSIQYLSFSKGKWSMGLGINSHGDVVGRATRKDGATVPYLYTNSHGMIDLVSHGINVPALVYSQVFPRAVNDVGEIVATYEGVVYLLTPVD